MTSSNMNVNVGKKMKPQRVFIGDLQSNQFKEVLKRNNPFKPASLNLNLNKNMKNDQIQIKSPETKYMKLSELI